MFIPRLRVEGSFCKCTNASLPLLSSVTGFDKLICVYVHSLSCLSHCANTLEFDPILILSQKWKDMPIHHTLWAFSSPSLPILLSSQIQNSPDLPRTGTSAVHTRVQQEHFVTAGRGTSQWSSVAESACMDYLFSYWLLFVGFLLLIEGTAWLSWWRPGHKACCELRQRVISLCSWPPEAVRKNTACNLWFYRIS